MSTPSVVQHYSTGIQDQSGAAVAKTAHVALPNPTLAGNSILLTVTCDYNASRVITITDDKSNTWVQDKSAIDSGNLVSTYIMRCAAPATGTQKIAIGYDAAGTTFHGYDVNEVAFLGVLDVSSSSITTTGTAPQPGSITPSVNGDFIYNYAITTANWFVNGTVTAWTPGSGFSWIHTDKTCNKFSQFLVQGTAAAINPTVTATGAGGSNTWNCIAVAYKAGSSGTLRTGGYIKSVFLTSGIQASGKAMVIPTSGNLIVVCTEFGNGQINLSSVASSPSNTWTKATITATYPQVVYAANATPSGTMTITPTLTGSSYPFTLMIYDIVGAMTSPYDSTAGTQTAQVSNTGTQPATLSNMPSITPSTASGVAIAIMANGAGPTTAVTAPSGAVLDSCWYDTETDSDGLTNADGFAHFYYSATTTLNFNWTNNSSSVPETSQSAAILFKFAATTVTLGGVVTGDAANVGNLIVTRALIGTVTGHAANAGTMKVSRLLGGAAQGTSGNAGVIIVTRKLGGTVTGVSQNTGTLKVSSPLFGGVITGHSANAGTIKVTRALVGGVLGTGSVTGNMIVKRLLGGGVLGVGQVAGTLVVTRSLTGTVTGHAANTGNVIVYVPPTIIGVHPLLNPGLRVTTVLPKSINVLTSQGPAFQVS